MVLRVLVSLPGPARRRLTSYRGGPARMLDAIVLPDAERLPPVP